MFTKNIKNICDAVVSDWVSDFDELDDHFKINLSRDDYYHKRYSALDNKTINDYLKTKVGSSYRYPTFKRRVEILISNGKIKNLAFDKLDNSILLNALKKVNIKSSKSAVEFLIDDEKFDAVAWFDYLVEQGQILGIDFTDNIMLFFILCYLRNIISFYELLPYQVDIDKDCLLFYCVDSNNKTKYYFVNITNPLATHFI